MKWSVLIAGLLFFGGPYRLWAAPMTFKELSLLVRIGETPQRIVEDTAQRRLLQPLSSQQETELTAAGATPALLAKLRSPALLATPEMAASYQISQQKAQSTSLPLQVDAPARAEAPRSNELQANGVSGAVTNNDSLPPFLNVPKEFVGSPCFQTKDKRISAGTAALAKLGSNGPLFILTARHLLGPCGGYTRLVGPEEIPDFVTGITMDGLFSEPRSYDVRGLSISPSTDENSALYDLSIFKVRGGSNSSAVELAEAVPENGAPVWFIAHVRGGVPKGQKVHGATVVGCRGDWLIVRYENQAIIANGASGSPVLNREGKMVGIFSGDFEKNGIKYALIIPVSLVRKEIQRNGE